MVTKNLNAQKPCHFRPRNTAVAVVVEIQLS